MNELACFNSFSFLMFKIGYWFCVLICILSLCSKGDIAVWVLAREGLWWVEPQKLSIVRETDMTCRQGSQREVLLGEGMGKEWMEGGKRGNWPQGTGVVEEERERERQSPARFFRGVAGKRAGIGGVSFKGAFCAYIQSLMHSCSHEAWHSDVVTKWPRALGILPECRQVHLARWQGNVLCNAWMLTKGLLVAPSGFSKQAYVTC